MSLTNVYTRLTFFQYGLPYVMEYNGNKAGAISTLKRMYGTKPVCIFEGKKDGYFRNGDYSTVACESVPNTFLINQSLSTF